MSRSPLESTPAAAQQPARPAATDCAHCKLPVPAALIRPEDEAQYCCPGCRTVAEAIQASGLSWYYQLVDQGEEAQPARTTGRDYAECDDPSFAEAHVRTTARGDLETVFYVEGVHCAACVWLVEKLPQVVPGVREARLDFGRRLVTVRWQEGVVNLSQIARALDRLGYPPHPVRLGSEQLLRREEERRQLIHIGVAGAIAGNVMLIAFALYGGWFHGMEEGFRAMFRWTSLGLALLAVIWPGRVFFRGAWGALRTRTAHMDLPIAIGLGAGLLGGAWNTVQGVGEVYFDSVTTLVFLLLVGRTLQERQQRKAFDAVAMLSALTPRTARRLEGATVREVPQAALRVGDRVEVRAGESVPADGRIVEGSADFDLALLTGESVPERRGVGELVHAGTVDRSDRVVVEIVQTGADTRVGQLMQLVEDHARRRAPLVRLADRLSGWFVAIVLVLAGINAWWWAMSDPGMALEHTVALLIVACPCALALATPLAVAAAIGQAATRGILVKGGEVLEQLAQPGLLLLDKTGTLTEGRMELQSWQGSDEARAAAVALESRSSHVLARAFVAGSAEGPMLSAEDVHETVGGGLSGRVAGRAVLVGSPSFLAEHGVRLDEVGTEAAQGLEQVLAAGRTPVGVALDGSWAGWAGFGDPLRADARASLDALRARGWQIGVLSGDHPRVVAALADPLGLDPAVCRGGMSPEDKLQYVEAAAREQRVVMVGDGVNDAAALAAARVGIAVHGGAEASLAAADAYLTEPGLAGLTRLFAGSRRTLGVIRRNLLLSLGYNTVGVSLAMAGLLHPVAAAILMPLSSLTVVSSSYRARPFPDA
ncbi:MAG: copper-translocating P-type ATPase [Planctomycetes bacterium]|nr:copper-translocating P-type ATPase [Planctomycetota bacterium]